MFGQSQSNFGFSNNSFPQQAQPNQMSFNNNSAFQGQQYTSQNDFYGQGMGNNSSMMQNQYMTDKSNTGMNTSFMQSQPNQFNMSMQSNNSLQMNNMTHQPQNSMMTQPNRPLENLGNQMNQTPIAEDGRQGSSAYTTYEDLPNYGQDIDLNQVVEQMRILFEDKSHWKPKFDAIDNLRILNKYHAKKMNEIIGVFWNYILESFDSQKTYIVKNILLFSTEAFMNAREVRIEDEVIMVLVPQVLNKSISEKSIIKKEAESALYNLFSNCCYDSAIMVLCKCCFEKNPAVCEVALATLVQMVSNIGDRLPMFKFETLQILMLTLGKIMDSAKKGNMKKWATNLCLGMYNTFGRENYQELVMSTVANQYPELAQYLAKAIEDKKEMKSRESNFHDFVQEKRKTMKFGMQQNSMQKMNGFSGMGQSFIDKKVLGENQQYGNNQMNMPYMQSMQGLHNMQNMQNIQTMQNMQNIQHMQQPSMGGLFNGQTGLNFPQNY